MTLVLTDFILSTVNDEDKVTMRILPNAFEISSDEGDFCIPRSIDFDYQVHSFNFSWQPINATKLRIEYKEKKAKSERKRSPPRRGNHMSFGTLRNDRKCMPKIKIDVTFSNEKSAKSVVNKFQ